MKYYDIFGPTYDPVIKQYFVKWKKIDEEKYQFKFFKTYSDAEKQISEIVKNEADNEPM